LKSEFEFVDFISFSKYDVGRTVKVIQTDVTFCYKSNNFGK